MASLWYPSPQHPVPNLLSHYLDRMGSKAMELSSGYILFTRFVPRSLASLALLDYTRKELQKNKVEMKTEVTIDLQTLPTLTVKVFAPSGNTIEVCYLLGDGHQEDPELEQFAVLWTSLLILTPNDFNDLATKAITAVKSIEG